jgi:hypothetical protein
MNKVSRRKFLGTAAAGMGAILFGANGCTPPTGASSEASANSSIFPRPSADASQISDSVDEKTLATNMAQAATSFLESLDSAQRNKAAYAFADAERFRWHWTTPRNFPRNGLPLTEMTEEQKVLAFTLLGTSISNAGVEKALNIMSLQRDLGNNPELYYVTLFGMPGDAAWGWLWEGHHLSRQFTLVGDQVAMTPFFLGSWPTTSDAGLRAMAREEDAGLELVNSLTGNARSAAIFQENTLTNHVTQNEPKVAPLAPVGIAYRELMPEQQQLIDEIIQTYLAVLPKNLAATSLERITAAGLEEVRFGWAGSLEHQRPQYYRVQGPTFLLEFDNSRNRGTHIHSVWRDFERDFGYHLL